MYNLFAFLEVNFTSSAIFKVDRELYHSLADAIYLGDMDLNLQ
jgi:hypothetical protein